MTNDKTVRIEQEIEVLPLKVKSEWPALPETITEMIYPNDILRVSSPQPRPGPVRRFFWQACFGVIFKDLRKKA